MSTPRVPTAEQQAVISSGAGRLVVRAGAGAGKTYVLTERYLRLVREGGYSPDQLLTITFTKKAAAEMKSRIVAALRTAGLDEAALIAETGPIQTIHSFFERLLRENAVAAVVDPAFEVLEGAEATRLSREAVRQAIATEAEEDPYARLAIRQLAGVRSKQSTTAHEQMERHVAQLLEELRNMPNLEAVRRAYANPDRLRAAYLDLLIRAVSPAFEEVPATDPAFHERLLATAKANKVKVSLAASKLADSAEAERDLEATVGLFRLAMEAWDRYRSALSVRKRLDFTELERRAISLLVNDPAVRSRVQGQFPVVLVDEAQDLSPLQYRLLELLDSGQMMLVGDVQQSIYGFRQADYELFENEIARHPSLKLTRNYRSAPGIQRFVDRVYGGLWGERYQPMLPPSNPFEDSDPFEFQGVQRWKLGPDPGEDLAAFVRDELEGGTPPGDITVLVRNGPVAKEIERALVAREIPCRILGGNEVFFTRMEVRDLANAMTAVANPDDDLALLSMLRSPLVGLSMETSFRLAERKPICLALRDFVPEDPQDRLRYARFLEWYPELSRYADRLAAWELLSELFARTDYLANVTSLENGRQILANVRKLLLMAAREPELGPREYGRRLRELVSLRHKEGEAPAAEDAVGEVQIMTIHKAKGLEFPVTIVTERNQSFAFSMKQLEIDPRWGLFSLKIGRASLWHLALTELRKARDTEEEQRLRYVAMTRAQRRLVLAQEFLQGRSPSDTHKFYTQVFSAGVVVHERVSPAVQAAIRPDPDA